MRINLNLSPDTRIRALYGQMLNIQASRHEEREAYEQRCKEFDQELIRRHHGI